MRDDLTFDALYEGGSSHMTQYDVEGGRTLTVAAVSQVAAKNRSGKIEKKAVLHWRENVQPWILPKQEGRLLVEIGFNQRTVIGKRLYLERDPDVMAFGKREGGSRIHGSPDIAETLDVKWRCGKNPNLQREIVKTPDPDPLWGLVVVRLGLSLEVCDRYAASKGMKFKPSQLQGAARDKVAEKLDTEDNRAALVAFAAGKVEGE